MFQTKAGTTTETSNPTNNGTVLRLHLPQTLGQTPLAKLPGIEQTLFGKVDVLHIRCIGGRRTADSRSDHDWISFKDDTVVDYFVNGKRDQVIVLDDSALVRGAPI